MGGCLSWNLKSQNNDKSSQNPATEIWTPLNGCSRDEGTWLVLSATDMMDDFCWFVFSWIVFLVFRRVTHIVPGRYGYGRAPYVAPLQTDTGQGSGTTRPHRQRRSAEADAHHHTTRGHGGHRSNNLDPSSNLHRYGRPYVKPRAQQPQNNQVWAPLYQPGPPNQAPAQQEVQPGVQTYGPQQHQERPYDPLPASFCTGEHVRYRICNSNVSKPANLLLIILLFNLLFLSWWS